MFVQVSTEADVQLVAFDYNPIVDLNIYPFCKNLDYDVVLECRTTGSLSFEWKSSFFDISFVNDHYSTPENITFILIMKEDENEFNSTFTSQLRIPTSVLREQMDIMGTNQLEVTCQTNSRTKRMVIIAQVPGIFVL